MIEGKLKVVSFQDRWTGEAKDVLCSVDIHPEKRVSVTPLGIVFDMDKAGDFHPPKFLL